MPEAPGEQKDLPMHRISLDKIAAAIGVAAQGDGSIEVLRAAEPATAGPDDLAMAMSPAYAEGLSKGAAKVAVMWAGADWQSYGLKGAILVARPRLAMAGVTALLDRGLPVAVGVHPTAVIDPSAQIGDGAAIGPLVVIGADVRIGAGAVLDAHVSIGACAVIGHEAQLGAGVHIAAGVQIGDRFIAQPGVKIGGDGFSFVTPEKSAMEDVRENLGEGSEAIAGQPWLRIHSVGGVMIGDDVEIGANSTVDQGTIRPTRIGNGTKIDNLVQVGHNVQVGQHCLLCAQAGVAGSTVVGDFVVLGGQSGVADNLTIGNGVIAGGGSVILSNVPAGRAVMGYPATKMALHIESYKALRRLPRLLRDISLSQKSASKPDKE